MLGTLYFTDLWSQGMALGDNRSNLVQIIFAQSPWNGFPLDHVLNYKLFAHNFYFERKINRVITKGMLSKR